MGLLDRTTDARTDGRAQLGGDSGNRLRTPSSPKPISGVFDDDDDNAAATATATTTTREPFLRIQIRLRSAPPGLLAFAYMARSSEFGLVA